MAIPNTVTMYPYTQIIFPDKITFGNPVIIDSFVLIYVKKHMTIGNYVHIAAFVSIAGHEEIHIGDFSGVSNGSRIFSATDDFVDWGFGNPTVPPEYRNVKSGPVIIGKFAMIGANAVILPGVTIGDGVTVGANSVVSCDLEPWGVYINNKRIRERNKQGVLATYEKFLANSLS